ncbi:MAG: hypothetical protein Q8Q81_18400 [Oxalobacteraceae bacterium]|nr:hypothetical protein [Oxalobacteraceae bacterium]
MKKPMIMQQRKPSGMTVPAQGDDIVPIPGTKRRSYLEQNVQALGLKLGQDALAELDAGFVFDAASGERYAEESMKMLSG